MRFIKKNNKLINDIFLCDFNKKSWVPKKWINFYKVKKEIMLKSLIRKQIKSLDKNNERNFDNENE